MPKQMNYTDNELKRWWAGLSHAERMEILGRMIEFGRSPEFGSSLMDQYQADKALSVKQLAAIRKWAR